MTKIQFKKVLIYCRESRDDGFVNYERIEVQRDILIDYCNKNKLGNIVEIILDDNKTGTDFGRLDPVKEMVRNKEVDIILCKDASRIGRNILQSLSFLEFLEKHKVEIIFESEKYDEDMFPLLAWFNERRAKEDSNKIRRVLRHKMEKGEIIIKAPFGYSKVDNNLVIDEDAACVVREIFDLFLAGYGKYEIASILNRKTYQTPSQYRKSQCNGKMTSIWNKQHIERILNHIVYTGDMPYGMRKKISFKSKTFENVPKEEWIILADHHESIISKEIFEKAQERMRRNKKYKPRQPRNNPFSGLIFCGRCNSRLVKKVRSNRKDWYACAKSDREGSIKEHIRPNYGCSPHHIKEDSLIELVQNYIEELLSLPEYEKDILVGVDKKTSFLDVLNLERKRLESKIETLNQKASLVYEDKLNGNLPEFIVKNKIDEIINSINICNKDILEIDEKIKSIKHIEHSQDKVLKAIKLIKTNGINNETLNLLFDKIIIFSPKEITLEAKNSYLISDEDYNELFTNGGIVFIQNFVYNTTVVSNIS